MESSYLGRLPGELRNTIYELALQYSEPIVIQLSTGSPQLVHNEEQRNVLAFNRVCKQMRHECIPIFYEMNEFMVASKRLYGQHPGDDRNGEMTKWQRALRLWIASIKYDEYRHLTHLGIDIGVSVAHDHCASSESLWRSVTDMLVLFDQDRTTLGMITEVLWRSRPRRAFQLTLPLTNTAEARRVLVEALAVQRVALDGYCAEMNVAPINASYMRMELENCGQELHSFVSLIELMGMNGV